MSFKKDIFALARLYWAKLAGNGCKAKDIDKKWNDFKQKYIRREGFGIFKIVRKVNFELNMTKIEHHNNLYSKGLKSFAMKPSRSAASRLKFEVYDMNNKVEKSYKDNCNIITDPELPKQLDWRTQGCVTPVKQQFRCGSCWAFATAGAIEAQNFFKTGKLISLSVQNLIDCVEPTPTNKNNNCNGNNSLRAIRHVIKSGGIATEESYPYQAIMGNSKLNDAVIGATISSYHQVKSGDEKELLKAVANFGPAAVVINCKYPTFKLYSHGVYDDPICSSTSDGSHAVLLVGYGTENGRDYWLIKNCWGTDWGDDGYMKIARNNNNQCGIANEALIPICSKFPVIDKGKSKG